MSKQSNSNRGQRRSRTNRKPRQIEENVDMQAFNKADFPHVLTEGKHNNDPSWYTRIYPAAKDLANVPYSIPVGSPFNPTQNKQMYVGSETVNIIDGLGHVYTDAQVIPGILSIELQPTIGYSDSANSAVNTAAQQLYTLVRRANSGATNYDKTDLMMMIIAMDSAYMIFEIFLRVYRLLGTYNYMNRYMPEALVDAMGFDYNSFAANEANFRGQLNLFAYQLASINVPDQFDFIKRHSWLFTNVYRDANLQRAQLYQFIPRAVYKWVEGVDDKPTHLVSQSLRELAGTTKSRITFDDFQTIVNNIMNPLLGSGDIGTMSGDLAKAFGSGGMIKIASVSEGEALVPVYDAEVLMQIANADVYHVNSFSSSDIEVDYSNTVTGPFIRHRLASPGPGVYYQSALKHFLNVPLEDPQYSDTIVATRLMALVSQQKFLNPASTSPKDNVFFSTGSELVTRVSVTSFGSIYDTGKIVPMRTTNDVSYPIAALKNNASAWMDRMRQVVQLSAFDWHPTQHVFEVYGENQQVDYVGHIQDDATYTYLEDSTVQQLNDLAIMSMFAAKDFPINM